MLSLTTLLDIESLAQHGSRLLRQQGLPRLHVVSDAATGLAGTSVQIVLASLLQWRQGLLFPWAAELFTVLCAPTQFVAIWTAGNPIAGWKA